MIKLKDYIPTWNYYLISKYPRDAKVKCFDYDVRIKKVGVFLYKYLVLE